MDLKKQIIDAVENEDITSIKRLSDEDTKWKKFLIEKLIVKCDDIQYKIEYGFSEFEDRDKKKQFLCQVLQIVKGMYVNDNSLNVNYDTIKTLFIPVYSASGKNFNYVKFINMLWDSSIFAHSNMKTSEIYQALIAAKNIPAFLEVVLKDDKFDISELKKYRDFGWIATRVMDEFYRFIGERKSLLKDKIVTPVAEDVNCLVRLVGKDGYSSNYYILKYINESTIEDKKAKVEEVIQKIDGNSPKFYESMLKEIAFSKNNDLVPVAISLMENHSIDYEWVQVEYFPKPLYLVILQSGINEVIQKYFDITGNICDIYYGSLENVDTVTLCEVYLGMGEYEKAREAFNCMNLYYSNEDSSYVDALSTDGYVPIRFMSPQNEGYLTNIINKLKYCNISDKEKKQLILEFISNEKVLFIHDNLMELLALGPLFSENEFQSLMMGLYARYQNNEIKFLINKDMEVEGETDECICVASEEEISVFMKEYIEKNKGFQKVKEFSDVSAIENGN